MLQLQNFKLYRPSLKHLLFGGIGGSVGILGVFFAVAVYIVETLTRPKKRSAFDNYTFSPYELDLPAEDVSFPALNGDHQVSGWYIPCEGATTTILICPGYRSRKADVLGMCRPLWKAGHNVLAFDYHGHGTEVGKPVTLGYAEINDFLGAIAYAKERAPESRLGTLAYSMGAAVAIMVAARSNDVEALILDSPFATHASVVDFHFRRIFHVPSAPVSWLADNLLWLRAGYHFHQVEPLRDITKIAPRPVLIIQSGKDSLVDPQDAVRLYDAAGEPKELWTLPNADHCGAYFEGRTTYVKRIVGFFDLYLKNVPQMELVEPSTVQEIPPITDQGLSEAS